MFNKSANDDEQKLHAEGNSNEKATITLPAVVQKVIPPVVPSEPEKAQIAVEGADHLYRELRVANSLKKPNGKKAALKPGAEVEVTIEAESEALQPPKG